MLKRIYMNATGYAQSYLVMLLCSAYQAVIFSSHMSGVIWYCISTWKIKHINQKQKSF